MVRIGVDFGGTKIEAAALDDSGGFLARLRAPNPGHYDAAIRTVCELVAAVESAAGVRGTVGVGAPGSLSPRSGVIRNSNSTYLNGRRFHDDLSQALGRPIRTANDANCLALSEALDGAASGAGSVFAAILGTGCGGGIVVDGRLLEGANGLGGEWGHVPLPWPDFDELQVAPCWCGQRGCLETWISGTGFERDHAASVAAAGAAALPLRAPQIVVAARAGDATAVASLDRYLDRLARALAMIVNLVDPEVFVFGGGMSNLPELYEQLAPRMRDRIFADAWEARLVAARWGDSSGVRGAARLW